MEQSEHLDDMKLFDETFVRDVDRSFTTAIATFKNFHIEDKIRDAVVIFGESHGHFDPNTRDRILSTCDLVEKIFDIPNCEAYELRTGLLNRYNFLTKPQHQVTDDEWQQAIQQSKENEKQWVDYCQPYLPGFKIKDWSEFIDKDKSEYFEQCRQLVFDEIQVNAKLRNAFFEDLENHSQVCSLRINSMFYLLEEMSMFYSLPVLFRDKKIYLIYPGRTNNVFAQMITMYPVLSKPVTYLTPKFKFDFGFKNEASFLLYQNSCCYTGFSYAVERARA